MVVVSYTLLVEIFVIGSVIDIKKWCLLYIKKSSVNRKNYVHEKFVCIALENLIKYMEDMQGQK